MRLSLQMGPSTAPKIPNACCRETPIPQQSHGYFFSHLGLHLSPLHPFESSSPTQTHCTHCYPQREATRGGLGAPVGVGRAAEVPSGGFRPQNL